MGIQRFPVCKALRTVPATSYTLHTISLPLTGMTDNRAAGLVGASYVWNMFSDIKFNRFLFCRAARTLYGDKGHLMPSKWKGNATARSISQTS